MHLCNSSLPLALLVQIISLRIDAFTPSRSLTVNRRCSNASRRSSFPVSLLLPHAKLATTTTSSRDNKDLTLLFAQSNNNNIGGSYLLKDPILKEAVKTLQRASWISWWSQVVLTVISSVILGFARTSHTKDGPNLFLSGTAIFISGLSIVWTWGNGSRLSRRLLSKPATRGAAANMLRRAVRVGVMLNLAGLLCNVLAAQEIIGELALRVLTQRQSLLDTGGLQPLDVLVVQANTNSLLSHYISLACLLYMTNPIARLDPPSRDGIDDI
jgi:Protein of unknown function (DUF3611)